MGKIHEYYCVKCSTQVKESDTKCPKCKTFLASNGAIKIKEITISDIKEKAMALSRELTTLRGWQEPCGSC